MTDELDEGAKKGGTPGHRGRVGIKSPDYFDPRKEKRGFRKVGITDVVYDAHLRGGSDKEEGRPYKNPYPKGKRHDAYHAAYHAPDRRDEEVRMADELDETRIEQGLEDHHPRVVSGVRGAKSKPFSRRFRNQTHMERWLEANGGDVDVHQVEKDHRRMSEGAEDAPLSAADVLALAAAERPADAQAAFGQLLRDRVAELVGFRREEMAQTVFAGLPEEGEDEDEFEEDSFEEDDIEGDEV